MLDRGSRQKIFCFGTIEARVHTGHVIEQLRHANPARQHCDISNERDIAHKFLPRFPRIKTEHSQFSFVRREPKNRVERGRLAGAVRSDHSEDPTFFDMKIDTVQCYSRAKRLTKTPCFYRGHGINVFSMM